MKVFLETLPVHDLGDINIAQVKREYEGATDAPQRVKVTTTLKVLTFEAGYAANRNLLDQLRAVLVTPRANLQWTDDNGQEYYNGEVTVVSHDLPEEWGEYHQRAELVFYHYETNLTTQNLPCTFAGFNFTHVLKWSRADTTDRVSPLHSERRMTQEKISVEGYILADATVPLAQRRDWLNRQQTAMVAALGGGKEGVLTLGDKGKFFNRTVRVENFRADLDQSVYQIPFSFTAQWTPFPSVEFAITDFAVEESEPLTGEQFLRFSGKVVAVDEDTARTTLAELQAAVLLQYGYDKAQPLPSETTANSVEADTDGTVFTELAFNAQFRRWRTDNLQGTFQKTGHTGTPVPLGEVRTQSLRYTATRMNEHHSQRSYAPGRAELAGTFPGDPTITLAARRAQLDAQLNRLYAEVNGADGTLIYGANFDRVVRVEDFHADINQEITAIEWSMTVTWSEFPADDGFATTEFTVTPHDNEEDGDQFITFAGRIRSTTKALALAKLAALRTSVLATYGYTADQRLSGSNAFGSFYANDDATAGLTEPDNQESAGTGTAFAELNFNEEYRRRNPDHVTWTLRRSTREDVGTGLAMTTYAGSVSASGQNADAAYASALAKAQSLGGGKEDEIGNSAFLRSSTVSMDERQTNAENVVEFVRLEFSYEYQSKLSAGRVYYELNAETQTNPFETDSVTVSGTIVGATNAELNSTYASIKAPYVNQLMRGERTTVSSVVQGSANQVLRMEFSFTMFNVKAAGVISYKYGLQVERDYLQLKVTRRIHGTVWAATQAAAAIAWSALVATLNGNASLGTLVRDSVDSDFNYASGGPGEFGTAGMFERADFDQSYEDTLTGITGLLEMSLTEEVAYSSPRWVILPTLATEENPLGLDTPQTLSTEAGSRTVSGEVTAAAKADAVAWAKKQRALLTGDASGTKVFQKEKWATAMVFLPRTEGVPAGDDENVQLWRVRFTFSEVLPNYPAPA